MIDVYLRTPTGPLQGEAASNHLRAALESGDGLVWVDLHGEERGGEGEALLRDLFGFHPLTIDDCFNHFVDPPKVDDYVDYLFVIIQDVAYERDARRLSVLELDIYVGANYVLTFHREPIPAIDDVRRRVQQNGLPLRHAPDLLMHAIFDAVVDGFQPVAEAIEEHVSLIEEQVLDRPERDTLEEVLDLKRAAQRLKRALLPQRDVANRFSRGEYEQHIRPESRMYFRDVYDHIVRVEDIIDSVRDLADGTLNTYLSSVNNRTNNVMRTLAIVSVIFLPLTLIASVYGTNFDNTFPSYDGSFGFYGMVISFGIIIAAALAFFRATGWMK